MKDNNQDLVSIVVPVYNSQEYLEDTIKTVEDQTYKNWELILVDDCSIDNSVDIIEKHMKQGNKISLIKLKENSGAAIARNAGMKAAEGKYIAFLDADDLWKPNKLEVQLEFMKNGNYVFTYTGYEFADKFGHPSGKVVNVPRALNYYQALRNTIIFTSTVILDVNELGKEIIKMPNVKRGQDAATWWKILRAGHIAHGLNMNLSLYRRGNTTLSSNKFRAVKRTWMLYRKVEKLSIPFATFNFIGYAYNAIKKRI
jgi:teichuronic acid biosynthesis glycosyltransferase TuaG